jgi:hypothetical protein
MIQIENKGQVIVSTNYWDSEYARNGYVFLSWNAGAARLLLPDSRREFLREMKPARYVIVSHGPCIEAGGKPAYELLFEDESDAPFSVQIGEEQTDRRIPESEQGGGFAVTVWVRGKERLRFSGRYRAVNEIPCLERWVSH